MTFQEIEIEALKLPETSRADLARNLLRSLGKGAKDPDHDRIWAEEAARRFRDLQENPENAVPIEDAIRKLRTGVR